MILLVILLIPLFTSLFLLIFRNAATVRNIALASTLLNLVLTLTLVFSVQPTNYSASWSNAIGFSFSIGYDGISLLMVLLTTLMVFILSSLAATFFSLVDVAIRTGLHYIIGG